jgi:hypothetical protein
MILSSSSLDDIDDLEVLVQKRSENHIYTCDDDRDITRWAF